MRCPKCHCGGSAVTDSRSRENDASIRRRRRCAGCGLRFTTYELFIDEVPGVRTRADGRVNPHTSQITDDTVAAMGLLSDDDAQLVRAMTQRLAGIGEADAIEPLRAA